MKLSAHMRRLRKRLKPTKKTYFAVNEQGVCVMPTAMAREPRPEDFPGPLPATPTSR